MRKSHLALPLSLLAAGVFFFPFWVSWAWLSILMALLAFAARHLLFSAVKTLVFMGLFTLPIALIRLFTLKEGVVIPLPWGLEWTGGGVKEGLAIIGRVLVTGVTSLLVFRWALPEQEFAGKWRNLGWMRTMFEAITIYQEMVTRFMPWWRKGRKKGDGIAAWIDSLYREGKSGLE